MARCCITWTVYGVTKCYISEFELSGKLLYNLDCLWGDKCYISGFELSGKVLYNLDHVWGDKVLYNLEKLWGGCVI